MTRHSASRIFRAAARLALPIFNRAWIRGRIRGDAPQGARSNDSRLLVVHRRSDLRRSASRVIDFVRGDPDSAGSTGNPRDVNRWQQPGTIAARTSEVRSTDGSIQRPHRKAHLFQALSWRQRRRTAREHNEGLFAAFPKQATCLGDGCGVASSPTGYRAAACAWSGYCSDIRTRARMLSSRGPTEATGGPRPSRARQRRYSTTATSASRALGMVCTIAAFELDCCGLDAIAHVGDCRERLRARQLERMTIDHRS